jgi:hypothetical protein
VHFALSVRVQNSELCGNGKEAVCAGRSVGRDRLFVGDDFFAGG